MKKLRVLALVIAVLSLVSLLFLVSCNNDSDKGGNCAETGEHKWSKWQSNNDATCTTDGTRSRKCPVCKTEEKETDPGTASGHYFVDSSYVSNEDATCTEDGTETGTCALCKEVTDTRVAENSALGHRYDNKPIADESFNGFNVFVCLRENCGHKTVIDDGTIDEDFEHCGDAYEDNTKRYVTESDDIITEIVSYDGGEGKYLMLKRSNDKILGNTAFGLYLTPDYSLYKSKDYVVSYDLLITETTDDLVLLEGKKANTEQVFATYDAETGKIMVNGNSVYTVTKGEWINIAFVLDDAKGEFDVYIGNRLVVSKAIYDKKDVYYIASDIDYLAIRMVAAARTASEFGIDNIKTYVGKTVTNPGEPMVKENTVSTVSVPTNIFGTIDSQWIVDFKEGMKATAGGSFTEEKFNNSFGHSTVDGEDVIVWQNFESGIPYFNIADFKGLEKYTIDESYKETYSGYDFSDGKTYEVYDLSGFDSITMDFYCDSMAKEIIEMGREGYMVLVALYTPNAWRDDKKAYWGSYLSTYITITAEDILNGEGEDGDGWIKITIPMSAFGTSNKIKTVTYFNISAKGWGNNGVGIGTDKDHGNNNDKNAVDGTVVKIKNISFNNDKQVAHVKPAEDCEHEYVETKTIAATCTTLGYTVEVCSKCEGERVTDNGFTHPLGHSYEKIMDIAATCTENGYFSEKCVNCGDKRRVEYIAVGHIEINSGLTEGDEGWDPEYQPDVIAPTCYSTGITVRTCGVCGEKWETDPTPIKDHEWGEGAYASEDDKPTCESTGTLTYTCIHNGENGCDGVMTETVDALGHNPVATGDPIVLPTCTADGYTPAKCDVCQKGLKIDVVKAHGHAWENIDDEANTAPTCYGDGVQVQQCTNTDANTGTACGEKQQITIPATAEHNFDYGNGTQTKAPTCVEKGEISYPCTNDGCTEVATEEVDLVAHIEVNAGLNEGDEGYDAEYKPVVTDVTCLLDGYTTRKCSVCGQEYTTDTVTAVGSHSDEGVEHNIQIADCIQDGWDKYNCSVCHEEVIVSETPSKGGHVYDIVLSDEDKALIKKCKNCGEKQGAYVDKAPTYAELMKAVNDNGNVVYAYLNIDSIDADTTYTGAKELGESDTVKRVQYLVRKNSFIIRDNGGVDNVDKYTQWNNKTEVVDGSHSYISVFPGNKEGNKVVFEVSLRLGERGTDGKYASWNSQILDANSKATTDTARQETNFLSMNGEGVLKFEGSGITLQLSDEKFTHIALAIDISTNKVNIFIDGVLTHYQKNFVPTSFADKLDMTKFQFDELRMFQYGNKKGDGLKAWIDIANLFVYEADIPYAVLGADYCAIQGVEHESDPELINIVSPTCTEKGYTEHTCKNCGRTWIDSEVDATGHTELEIGEEYNPTVIAPTCTEKGYTIHTCKTCGETWTDSEVDATGHTELEIGEEYNPTVIAPTCFTKGYTERICATCGEKYITDETEMVEHVKKEEPTEVIAPTCTEAGKNIYSCATEGCTHTFEEVVEATGHDPESEITKVIAPNCVEGGYTVRKCSVCGMGFKTDELPANGHDYPDFEVTKEPTCTEKGLKYRKCKNCIVTETEEINALGHDWQFIEEHELTFDATCYRDGSKFYDCSRCDESKTEAVTNRPAHDYGDYQTILEPTCTEKGKEVRTCKVEECGYQSDRAIPAKGHDMDEGVVTTVPDCENDGVRTLTCKNGCGHTEDVVEPAIGHNMVDNSAPGKLDCDYVGTLDLICANGCGHTETQEKTATEHKFIPENGKRDWIILVESTCYSEGIRTSKCLNPGCTKDSYQVDPEDRANIQEKKSHNMSTELKTVEPTSSTSGYTYYECLNEGCEHYVEVEKLPALSDLEFELLPDGSGYIVVGYTGNGGVLTIPATYEELPVVDVDANLFGNYGGGADSFGITAVIIEADMSGWTYGIFAGCTFDYVVIGESTTTVPYGIFEGAYITNIYYSGNNGDITIDDIDSGMINDGAFTYDDIIYNSNGPEEEEAA